MTLCAHYRFDGKPGCAIACQEPCGESCSKFLRVGVAPTPPERRVSVPTAIPSGPGTCRYLGGYANQTTSCPSCSGRVSLKVFKCGNAKLSGKPLCTLARPVQGFACCNGDGKRPCPGFAPQGEPQPTGLVPPDTQRKPRALVWTVGVTTVPQRRGDLLLKTLESLNAAGFVKPRLFVDGEKDAESWRAEFGLEVTARFPVIRTHGNWFLALGELFIRTPNADRFAIFQDDLIAVKNLRPYLDLCKYPDNGYWNLLTFPQNQKGTTPGFYEAPGYAMPGYAYKVQRGLGAVGLVFSRDAALEILFAQHMVERPIDADRGWKAVDGGVVTAANKAGYREYVHSPSLIQHTGVKSTMGNLPHPLAPTFPGAGFDALSLVSGQKA
jgi:hypothetical protein